MLAAMVSLAVMMLAAAPAMAQDFDAANDAEFFATTTMITLTALSNAKTSS